MRMKKNDCVDLGSESCPCVLAESGGCLVCEKLSGGTCNDCNWQGTCVYTLYSQNEKNIIKARHDKLFKIAETKEYSESLKVFKIDVGKGFCQKALAPGSYVFIRRKEDEPCFSLPISVLRAEEDTGILHLAICKVGPKSNRVFNAEEEIFVRGVYSGGLKGQLKCGEDATRTKIFAKGIAIAPLRNILDSREKNKMICGETVYYIDIAKITFDFLYDYFGDIAVCNLNIIDFENEGIDTFKKIGSEAEKVYAFTSPYYCDVLEKISSNVVRPALGNFCCGEGICGACTHNDEKGNVIRSCKVK